MTVSEKSSGLLEQLRKVLENTADSEKRFAVAYSGGLDSRFLTHAAKLLGFKPVLFHVTGPHAGGDEAQALEWADAQGVPARVIALNPLSVPEVREGSRYRCYGCKKAVFTALLKEAAGLPLCDGTNHTDELPGVWRPGKKALKELGIRSPLSEAGFGKPEIRLVARETGMERPDQLPEPCMLTRFPYGMTPEKEVIDRLKNAENAIRSELRRIGKDAMMYRLRIVKKDAPELHFSAAGWDSLTETERESVRTAAAAADPEFFRNLVLRRLDKLSGFFDREKA